MDVSAVPAPLSQFMIAMIAQFRELVKLFFYRALVLAGLQKNPQKVVAIFYRICYTLGTSHNVGYCYVSIFEENSE
jgi:hypothetical protein